VIQRLIEPITIRSLGAILLPIPKADEGMICGSTKVPATTDTDRLTKSRLDDLFAIIYYLKLSSKNIKLNAK
jgi:hypothetical protein